MLSPAARRHYQRYPDALGDGSDRKRQGRDHDSLSSDELCQMAPHVVRVGHVVQICQDGEAGRRQARERVEHGVDERTVVRRERARGSGLLRWEKQSGS